jgi:FkbM family methyltransferase
VLSQSRAVIKQQFPSLLRFVRKTRRAFSNNPRLNDEAELALLPRFVARDRLAIDVGANVGTYTEALTRLAKGVVAIEANPTWAKQLSDMFKGVNVICAAASNTTGHASLRIPRDTAHLGMATIEDQNVLENVPVNNVTVDLITIDSLNLENVGFVKIDVEGHEEAVLEGAAGTIQASRPNLLIEAEERHRPDAVSRIMQRMNSMGYSGFMLVDGMLESANRFDASRHQQRVAGAMIGRNWPYVNNFFFVPNY